MSIDHRIILNAALNRIVQKQQIERSVEEAVNVISHYSAMADQTLFFMNDRPNSDWLKEKVKFFDMTNVGHYVMSRVKKKDYQIVTFQNQNIGVEFYFERTKSDAIIELLKRSEQGESFSKEQMSEVLLGQVFQNKNLDEMLVGDHARSLETFALNHVDLLTPKPIYVLGFELWQTTDHETVYQSE